MSVIEIKRIEPTTTTPPGGSACHWCAGRLYRDKKNLWHYGTVEEQGYTRAVHLQSCCGLFAGDRPRRTVVVSFDTTSDKPVRNETWHYSQVESR